MFRFCVDRTNGRDEYVTVTNDQQINGSDVESNLVDSILYDIRSGFPHKKSFDKVRARKLNFQTKISSVVKLTRFVRSG